MIPRYALFYLTVASLTLLPVAAMTRQNVEPGFTSLFNGKDLTGWVYGARGGAENKSGKGYQVENGVLFTRRKTAETCTPRRSTRISSSASTSSLTENANNGIGIRAPLEGDAAYVGMEIQVLDDGGSQYTSLQPAQYHGSIYGMVRAEARPPEAGRRVELGGDHREGAADHGEAQRRDDRGRQPGRREGRGDAARRTAI